MAQSPQFKVFNPAGKYIAACRHIEDAAMLVGAYGQGAKIKFGHSMIVWTEGSEAAKASDSFDAVAQVVSTRIRNNYIASLKKNGWSDEKINEWMEGA